MAGVHNTRLSSALRDIEKAVDNVTDLTAFTVDRAELDQALCELIRLRNKFDAMATQVTTTAETAGIHFGSRIRSAATYVAAKTSVDPAKIRRSLTVGRWLRDFDVFSSAFFDGDIGVEHLDYIRTKLDSPVTHAELKHSQEELAGFAAQLTFADFKRAGDYWLAHIDPDGKEPQDQIDKASLSLHKGRGGRLVLKGQTDALSGQAIQTAVDHEANKLMRQDAENGVTRTETQRRMAALHNLVVRGFARADGTIPTPLINVVMSEQVAEWLLTQQDPNADPADSVPVAFDDVDGRSELIDGTAVHPGHLLPTLGIATLRRYIMDADSRLIDVSVNARAFPAWMKTAIHVQSRGQCETHGCDAPINTVTTTRCCEPPASNSVREEPARATNDDNHAKTDTPNQTPWRDRDPPPRH